MVAKVASGKSTKYTSEVQFMMKLCPCVTMVAALTDSKQSQTLLFVCHDINQHNVLVTQAHTMIVEPLLYDDVKSMACHSW